MTRKEGRAWAALSVVSLERKKERKKKVGESATSAVMCQFWIQTPLHIEILRSTSVRRNFCSSTAQHCILRVVKAHLDIFHHLGLQPFVSQGKRNLKAKVDVPFCVFVTFYRFYVFFLNFFA